MVDAIRNFSSWEKHNKFEKTKRNLPANWNKTNGLSNNGVVKVIHGQPPVRRNVEDRNRLKYNFNNEVRANPFKLNVKLLSVI